MDVQAFKETVSQDLGIFNWIYIGRASFRDPPLIVFKFLCCVVIELINLKDPMRLMQKTYLFPEQIGMPLANASKICRIRIQYSSRILVMRCCRILVSRISIAEKIR